MLEALTTCVRAVSRPGRMGILLNAVGGEGHAEQKSFLGK